jgi:autotransporter-associated beta strand protein
MNKAAVALAAIGISYSSLCHRADAGSATWNVNPTSNLWLVPENWTPVRVPSGKRDIATFGTSNISAISLGPTTDFDAADTQLDSIVFVSDASAYTLTLAPSDGVNYAQLIEFFGAGIVNNSGKVQNFLVSANAENDSAVIWFEKSASAGNENVVITNQGSQGPAANGDTGAYGGATIFGLQFTENPSAGRATFINEGSTASETIFGGFTKLLCASTAEAATFINQPGTVADAAAGHTFIETSGNMGTSTFINNAALVDGAEGGWTEIDTGTCDGCSFISNGATTAGPQGGQVYAYGGSGYATFTANGGSGSGSQGGLIDIFNFANSSQTVVTAKGGANGGLGGLIRIEGFAGVDQAQFRLLGNGTLDLSGLLMGSATIGSLSGRGIVILSTFTLNIGSNNLNTSFSGVIQNSGAVGKVGTGSLTLKGASSYSEGTTVAAGTLVVANQVGSATGSGPVEVQEGTLGGSGIISGAVSIGTGNGTGAFLAPAVGTPTTSTLTIQGAVTFEADGTFTYKLNTKRNIADQVIAHGVTIEGSAKFDFTAVANKRLALGSTFTAINNTSANPISGTFANLVNGSTFTAGRNKFEASYSGGDGNDLTLTVVP